MLLPCQHTTHNNTTELNPTHNTNPGIQNMSCFCHFEYFYCQLQTACHRISRLCQKTFILKPGVPGFSWDLSLLACYYMLQIVNPMDKILGCEQSCRNNLKIMWLCVCNWLYDFNTQLTATQHATRNTQPGIHSKSFLRQVGCFYHYTTHCITPLPCQHTTHNNSSQPTQRSTHTNVFIPRASCATLDVAAVNTQQLAWLTQRNTHTKVLMPRASYAMSDASAVNTQHTTTPLK